MGNHLFNTAEWTSEEPRIAYAEAVRICEKLREHGHVGYFAGGCVRDALLGRQPKDFDVATDAVPNRVRRIFGRSRTLAFGASFGVIGVLPDRSKSTEAAREIATLPTEVATFRSDGEYTDGRRPNEVHFGDAENDAQRRDFTVNGLFYDPASERVIDYVNGEKDLEVGLLRTIGDPEKRFEEDKLRMLRAVRFATTLDFEIEGDTRQAIIQHAHEIRQVSAERIGAEMRRVLVSPRALDGLQLLKDLNLESDVLPALADAEFGTLRRRFDARMRRQFESSLAILLLSIKRDVLKVLAELARGWRLSNEEQRRASAAIKLWQNVANAHEKAWSEVQPILIDRDVQEIMDVAEAMVSAHDLPREGIERCCDALTWDRERLDPAPLLTGDRLRDHGFKPGPEFRTWLQTVRNLQLDGKLHSPESALDWIRENGV